MKLFRRNTDLGLGSLQLGSLGGEVVFQTSVLLLKMADAAQKLKDSCLEDFECFFPIHKLETEDIAHRIKSRFFIGFPKGGFNGALSVAGTRARQMRNHDSFSAACKSYLMVTDHVTAAQCRKTDRAGHSRAGMTLTCPYGDFFKILSSGICNGLTHSDGCAAS